MDQKVNRKKATRKARDRDVMKLDIGPFANGAIPFDRPVIGLDLENLRQRLGLKVNDATWFFGMNIISWYKHTTDPVEKLKSQNARERERIMGQIADAQGKLAELKRAKEAGIESITWGTEERTVRVTKKNIDAAEKEVKALSDEIDRLLAQKQELKKARAPSDEVDSALKEAEKAYKDASALHEALLEAVEMEESSIKTKSPAEIKVTDKAIKEVAEEIKALEKKLDETQLTPLDIKKAEKAAEKDSIGPYKPVKESLALLVRFYDAMEDYIDEVTLRPPTVQDFADKYHFLTETDVGVLLGRDQSAAYRWLHSYAEPHPTVRRLIGCLMRWLDRHPFNERTGEHNIEIWRNVVDRELALRGKEMGRVKKATKRTMPSKRSRRTAVEIDEMEAMT